MDKLLLLVFTMLVLSFASAQERIHSIQIDTKFKLSDKESYTFSNIKNDDLALIIEEYGNIFATLFNKDFEAKSILITKKIKKKYLQIIGYTISGDVYSIVSRTNNRKKYAVQTFDFEKKASKVLEFDFNFEDETYVETFQYNNDLFMIHANEKNTFILRKLDSDFQFIEVKRYKVQVPEKNKNLLKTRLFNVGLFGSSTSNVTKINIGEPNALEQAIAKNKLYQSDKIISLTIENGDDGYTSKHSINLVSLKMETKIYEYPKGKKGKLENFNSFLLNDYIFQLGSSNNEMIIVIKNLEGIIIKEHYIDSNKTISIKNSPVMREGSELVSLSKREKKETKKFLDIVTADDIGICCHEDGDLFYLTIGASFQKPYGYGASLGLDKISMTYNPIIYSFSGYDLSVSTYFDTSLDQNFDYIKSEKKTNAFARIKAIKEKLIGETGETVFFHDKEVYFGYYDNRVQAYHIYKM